MTDDAPYGAAGDSGSPTPTPTPPPPPPPPAGGGAVPPPPPSWGQQPSWQQPPSGDPAKKSRTGLFLGLGILAIFVFVVLVAGALLVLGSDAGAPGFDGDDPRQALLDAAEETRDVGVATVASDLRAGGDLGEFVISLEGRFDFQDEIGASEISADSAGSTTEAEYRSDGETAWIRIVSAEVDLPDGVDWIGGPKDELDDADVTQPLDESFAPFFALEGVVDATDGGVEDFDGDEVRRYDIEVDLEEADDRLSSEDAAMLEEAFSLTGDNITVEGEAYIDGDGRLRRLVLDGSASDDFSSVELSMDFTITDIGGSVDVEEPDDVTPFDEVEEYFG